MKNKDLANRLASDKRGSAYNIRRYAENFPLVERGVDRFNDQQPFKMDFDLSDHPHTVSLDIFIRENPIYPQIEPPEQIIRCVTNCPWFLQGGDWSGNIFGGGLPGPGFWAAYYDKFNINIGGFQLNWSGGGVIVPISGYYQINAFANVAGVSNWGPAYYVGEIRAGGGSVLASKTYYQPYGLQWTPTPMNITTVAYLPAGTVVGLWMAQDNFAYFTAYNFCGWWGGRSLAIDLIGV